MNTRHALWGGLALVVLLLLGFGAWLWRLPEAPASTPAPPIPQAELAAMLTDLKPPRHRRPLVAIVGLNDATETTDYLMPAGILRRADVADVMLLATAPGPVQLYPALRVDADATTAGFDAAHPDGADYVVVPAMSRDDDTAVLAWLRGQANKGAMIISVCAGAKVVGAAGLLDGQRATTHWYYLKELLERSPSIAYVPDRRMVVNPGIATTTGVTASMPTMLMLIEAMAGRARAEAVARDLGVAAWDARHASGAFRLTRPFASTVLGNRLAFWSHERLGMALRPGMDEVALALVADAWSRTYRSKVVTFAASAAPVVTRAGIRVHPDTTAAHWPSTMTAPTSPTLKPAAALNHALAAIGTRYGRRTADVVAMQLEYPRPNTSTP